MEWIGYIFIVAIVGAVVLAIYERRKGLKIVYDDVQEVAHDRKHAAYAEGDQLRAEESALH